MTNQLHYFEAKEEVLSAIQQSWKKHQLDALQVISLLSSLSAEIADVEHKSQKVRKEYEEEKKVSNDHLIGKRVKVNVGNDTWGEVIVPGFPYLVTCEVDGKYGLSPISDEITDEVLVEKHYHKLTVHKTDVELWKTPMERFLNPERISMPDIDVDFDNKVHVASDKQSEFDANFTEEKE
ncbi:hypothetical protein CVD28_24575 [Bacillus sp. M6-12]|uniref:hypothetical protein n=1 Tax=Bacillus sp. M6-12 TaxID=2054166 RepID=UPI000C778C26|nr:hypothetical protein [Bacillus sp. M6-12]PLS15058.1 hypothetical protein CVD28_24575 [Bacillus sp. M6-12]